MTEPAVQAAPGRLREVALLVPAFLIVLAIAWAYVRYGTLPQAEAVLYGVKPVIIAVVLQALWGLARAAVKGPVLGALGAAALVLTALGLLLHS